MRTYTDTRCPRAPSTFRRRAANAAFRVPWVLLFACGGTGTLAPDVDEVDDVPGAPDVGEVVDATEVVDPPEVVDTTEVVDPPEVVDASDVPSTEVVAQSCGDCLTLSANPDFHAAYLGGQAAYTGMDCATLDAQNVPLPPYTIGINTQMGRWCALQEAGAQAGCGPTSQAGQCPALLPAPTCASCATYSNDPGYQQSYQLVSASYAAMSCADLQAANVPLPLNPSTDPAYPGEVGKWCGYQAALAAQCGNNLGCPAPVTQGCGDCATLSSDPSFQIAYQAGTATYTGMDCAMLDAQNVPNPPFTQGIGTQMGRWCAIQEAGAAAGCGPASTSGQCPALTPPTCVDCGAFSSDPSYQFSFQLVTPNFMAMTCNDLQAANVPGPLNPPNDPAYPGELGKWCGYEAALAAQCGNNLGCPAPPAQGCGDCATLSPHPDFQIAYQAGTATYTGMDCATLIAQNVPSPPFTIGIDTQMGRWCAIQEAGAAAGCGPATSVGQCPALTSPSCVDCSAFSSDPGYQASYQMVTPSYLAMTCADLQAANVPGPLNPPNDPAYPGELGKWCGYQAGLATQCGNNLGCPAPAQGCGDCASLSTDPNFQIAYASGTATYNGMDCATLDLQNVPAPPFTIGIGTQMGRWCALQEAGVAAGCGPASPAGQCPDPGPPTCADCGAFSSDAGYQASFQLVTQFYASMTCVDLQAANVPGPLNPPNDPAYPGELGKWCGYQAALAAECGNNLGCPAPQTCADCGALSGDPNFQIAFQSGLMTYNGMDCTTLDAQGVPAPPFSVGIATQLGRWCALQEAGAAAACGPASSAGACPGQSLCQGTALCMAHCGLCADPVVAQNGSFLASAWAGWTSYSTQSCGSLGAFTIPAPSAPWGSAPWYVQLGRWCAYERSLTAQACASSCVAVSFSLPMCSDCTAQAGNPAFQAAFANASPAYNANVCADIDPVGTTPIGTPVAPPLVTLMSMDPGWTSELGVWCAYQDALDAVCAGAEGGCP